MPIPHSLATPAFARDGTVYSTAVANCGQRITLIREHVCRPCIALPIHSLPPSPKSILSGVSDNRVSRTLSNPSFFKQRTKAYDTCLLSWVLNLPFPTDALQLAAPAP